MSSYPIYIPIRRIFIICYYLQLHLFIHMTTVLFLVLLAYLISFTSVVKERAILIVKHIVSSINS